jgi:uncharacterized protein (DUF58 family)
MSFRTGRSLPGERTEPLGEEALEPEDDPGLIATIAATDLNLRPAFGILLIAAGGLLGIAILVMFGTVVLATVWIRSVWARRALRRLRYERRFEPDRIMAGDEAQLLVSIWNRKLLPLPWVRSEEPLPADLRPADERAGRDRAVVGRSLINGWTLGPHERVVRRIALTAERRGVYRFGPVALSAGDLLGEAVAEEERSLPASLVVRPRTVPVRRFDAARDRAGPLRAQRGLVEDPTRFAGVRPYAPGDPIRHVHWRTTARIGTPMVKRFDPSRDRDVVIALDIQTSAGAWAGRHDDDLAEALCVVAASLARQLEAEGAACGLAVAAFTGSTERLAFLAPGSAERQAGRIGDLLAQISPYPSAPFEHLLGRLVRSVRPGSLIVIVSARDPRPWSAVARRLSRSGYGLLHLAVGPEAAAFARRSRDVGIAAWAGRLDGDWRTATRLDVAG